MIGITGLFKGYIATATPSTSTGTGISPGSIMPQIWNMAMTLLQTIMNGVGGLFQSIFGGIGKGLDIMFMGWGNSLSTYGIWGPAMTIISLVGALLVGYILFDVVGIERDILGGEEDL
uniref:Hypothetical membrane protein n=1 Tax=Thermoplasma acidophilum TaxID=2303 RepID=Q0KKY8_THEAI|nr:hypothetical membrane protein [Thermoplasma acidophilum]